MTATYSGNPTDSDKDRVRFLLRDNLTDGTDTNVISPKLSDEEIAYLLDEFKNPYAAASEGAYIIAASYTDRADKTVGPLSIKYGEFADRWNKLGDKLSSRAGKTSGAKALTTQTKRSKPIFAIGMNDNLKSYIPSEPETETGVW